MCVCRHYKYTFCVCVYIFFNYFVHYCFSHHCCCCCLNTQIATESINTLVCKNLVWSAVSTWLSEAFRTTEAPSSILLHEACAGLVGTSAMPLDVGRSLLKIFFCFASKTLFGLALYCKGVGWSFRLPFHDVQYYFFLLYVTCWSFQYIKLVYQLIHLSYCTIWEHPACAIWGLMGGRKVGHL